MRTIAMCVGIGLLALFSATWLARPIQDPDFFWHLKIGEWLWLQRSWPIPDPFAFTSPEVFDLRQLFIIKGYWLSQLLYYASYSTLGWSGIYLLRLLIFCAFAWALWKYREPDTWLWGSFALFCLAVIFAHYPVERPQFFSFLLFTWLYLLLNRLWSRQEPVKKRHLLTIALIMLLWGNLHGGFIIGQGLLLITLAIHGLAVWRRPGEDRQQSKWLCGLAIIGLIAGLMNPNALRILPILAQLATPGPVVYATNEEFASIFMTWQGPGRYLAAAYGLTVVLTLAAVARSWRQCSPGTLLAVAGTAIYAAIYIRFIPFFLVAALPVLCRGASTLGAHRGIRVAAMICVAGTTLFLAATEVNNIKKVRADGWVSNQDFPVEVAERVIASGIDGHLFNTYRWGGYLLWRLGPERQVFVDGRAFDSRTARDALTAEMVSFGHRKDLWREVFARHEINYAILPIREKGSLYALTQTLARDPQWRVEFSSGNAALMVKQNHRP